MKLIIDNPEEFIKLLGMSNMNELSDYVEKNTDAKAVCYERERNTEDPHTIQFDIDCEEHGYDDNDVWEIHYEKPEIVFPYEGFDPPAENMNDWAWDILEDVLHDVEWEFKNWLDVAKHFGKEPNVKNS